MKRNNIQKLLTIVTGFILIVGLLTLPACGNPLDNPEVRNKIVSELVRLIQADREGKAREYARPRGIDLSADNEVRVIVGFQPKDGDRVLRYLKGLGKVEVTLEKVVQVLVLISNIVDLAEYRLIIYVRRPT